MAPGKPSQVKVGGGAGRESCVQSLSGFKVYFDSSVGDSQTLVGKVVSVKSRRQKVFGPSPGAEKLLSN